MELSPKLGGIVFRQNSNGNKVFSPNSIFSIISYPFKNLNFWYPRFWDLNIFIILIITSLIFYFL